MSKVLPKQIEPTNTVEIKQENNPYPNGKCFIAMPITVYPHVLNRYRGNTRHFTAVLNAIFIPAAIKAGFEPVAPVVQGSEVIQRAILKNLTECEMALFDMSTLNANVFLEAGIRITSDKPAAFIKDNTADEKCPFDLHNVGYCEYNAFPDYDMVYKEVDTIAKHITDTFNRNTSHNLVWQHYQMEKIVQQKLHDIDKDGVLQAMQNEIEELRLQFSRLKNQTTRKIESPLRNRFPFGVKHQGILDRKPVWISEMAYPEFEELGGTPDDYNSYISLFEKMSKTYNGCSHTNTLNEVLRSGEMHPSRISEATISEDGASFTYATGGGKKPTPG